MFKSLTEKPLWINILVVVVIAGSLIFIFFGSLNYLTQHGKIEKVPQVTGLTLEEAKKIILNQGFDYEVLDSVYVDTAATLTIIKQSPISDAAVKANRTIYLTVNRLLPPEVIMPSLIGFSIRNAELYLKSLGLRLGDTSYRPDIARNAVLEQLYKGQQIKPGTKMYMGSTIDFVLGDGIGINQLNVPDVIGMTFIEAKNYIFSNKLNVGSVIALDDIGDTTNAFVVKTNPPRFSEPTSGNKVINKIRVGQLVDLYLSKTAPIKDSITIN